MENYFSSGKARIIPEKKMTEIIKILLKNLMDQTDNIDIVSKKTICDLSNTNLKLIIQLSVDSLNDLLKEKITENTINSNLDKILNIVNLYEELLKKNGTNITKDLYKYISCFINENFTKIKGTPIKIIKMYKDQLSIIMKSYIHFASIYFDDVIQDILILFPPGSIPDRLVLETLTEMAKLYPNEICNNCLEILTRCLPIIENLSTEKSKVNFSNFFSQVAEAIIISYEINSSTDNKEKDGENKKDKEAKNDNDNEKEDGQNKKNDNNLIIYNDIYSKLHKEKKEICQIFNTAYDKVKDKWLQNIQDNNNKLLIIRGIIMIAAISPLDEKKIRLDDMCLLYTKNIIKNKNYNNLIISSSYRMFLEINIKNEKNKNNLVYSATQLLKSIYPLLNEPNMSPNVVKYDESFIKLKSELLRILYLLFTYFFDTSFDFIINKMSKENSLNIEKITSIYILSFMLIRVKELKKENVDNIISLIYTSMKDKDLEVRYSLCDLIYVLFEKNVVDYKNSSIFLSYLISDCGYTDQQVESFDNGNCNNLNNKSDNLDENNRKENIGNNKLFSTNLKMLRDKAERTVLDIINKIPNTLKFIFPQIFDILWSSSILGGSYYLICEIVNDLFEKFNDEISSMEIEQNKFSKVPQPDQILVKMMIILADPTIRNNLYNVSQRSFKNIINILHPDLANLVLDMSELETYLSKNSKFFDYSSYHEILLRQWDKIILSINSEDYLNNISKTIKECINQYKYEPYICGLLLRMQGVLLSRIDKRDIIRNQLDNLFSIAHPQYANETVDNDANYITPKKEIRLGVAEAFGYAGRTNLDFVFEKVNGIFKSEISSKKSNAISLSTFTNLFRKNEINAEIIITLITSLGCIAKYAPAKSLTNRINSSVLNYLDDYYQNDRNNKRLKLSCLIAYGNLFKNLEKLSSAYLDKGNIFYLEKRNFYLNKMVNLCIEEKEVNNLKIEAMNNIAYLIKLDPPISIEQCSTYVNLAFSIFDMKLVNNIKIELRNKIFESACNILESLLTHDIHVIEQGKKNNNNNTDKIKKFNDFFGIVGGSSTSSKKSSAFSGNEEYKYILNYDKQTLSQWDIFSYILERFKIKYSNVYNEKSENESDGIVKKYIIEKIKIIVNNLKNIKVDLEKNGDLFKNWTIVIMCLFHFAFGENNTEDCHGLFLSICRLLTGIDTYEDIDITDSETFIVQISKIFKNKFSKINYLYIFQIMLNLLKSNIQSISHYSSLLLTNLLLTASDYFLNEKDKEDKEKKEEINKQEENKNISENLISNSQKENLEENKNISQNLNIKKITSNIPDITLDNIMDQIIKILEEVISEENSTRTKRVINILDVTEALSKINLDIIIYTSLNEKYGQLFPIALSTIIQNLCNDKSSISKIFIKITDIINNVDPGVDNNPNFIVSRSTVILGTMLDSHDEIITPLIKRFIPQLLSTLLLRIGSSHSILYDSKQFITKEEDPRNQAVWALQKLMAYYDQVELYTCLESNGSIAKKLLSKDEFDEGVYEFMMIYCKISSYNEQYNMYEFLSGFINRAFFGQRLVVISCFAQFVNFSSFLYTKKTNIDINEWRNSLLNNIAKMIDDINENCRKMAMRGLGNLCNLFLTCSNDIDQYIMIVNNNLNEEDINDDLRNKTINTLKEELIINNYSETVVNMIIGKLEDSAECVILETLNTLQQIINYISFETFNNIINNLLVKMRPCLDHNNFNIRALGFNLMNRIVSFLPEINQFNQNNNKNNLSNCYNNYNNNYYYNSNFNKKDNETFEIIRDQINANLISLMLHSIDEKIYVANNAFKVLIKGLIVILGEDLTETYDKIKNDNNGNNDKIYEEFMITVVNKICQNDGSRNGFHINNCISHSLSGQESIRAYSSFIIGIFYNATKIYCNEYLKNISLEPLINNFIKLINDSSNKVKSKAMNSIKFINN